MRNIKTMFVMAAALVGMVANAGECSPIVIDLRNEPIADTIAISWDASWIGGDANATVVISDNGTEVKRATGSGQFTYQLSSTARHELTYTTYIGGVAQSEVYATTAYSKYVVSFDANSGSVGEAIRYVTPGNAIGTLPTPTRNGYTFKGWWTSASDGTQITASTTVSGHVTYYAHWTINQYTVTFNANGGTVGTTSVVRDYDQAVGTLPTPTRTEYVFGGWWTSASGGTRIYSSTKVTSNVTYYAHWTINQYTVTFNANGGTVSTSYVVRDYDQAVGTLPTPTHADYNTFVGWWTAASGGTQISESTIVTGNVTFYAHWKNMYTATFDANGGTGGTTKKQEYGTSLTAPTVTRTGYTFTGWSPSVPSTMPAGNTTYTAQWKINQYTVTFNANGGTGGWSRKQDYGTAIVAPTVTREWFNFTGWSPAVAATVPANNVTYTAQWKRYGDSISVSKMGGKTMRQLYPSDYTTMTTVVLEEGVTELPEGFFDGCGNVEFVTWPSTLLEFGIDDLPPKIRAAVEGKYAQNGFLIYNNWILDYQNRNASVVTIPNGIVGIGRGAFAEMYDLERVNMPESLRCIAKGAFEGCTWIQEFQFMSGLRYVGAEAFRDCSSLLKATFADGVRSIGESAFTNCWQMQSVRLPYTVTDVGDNAFSGCGAIRGVTVPTHVKTMKELLPQSYAKIETAEVAEGEKVVMAEMFKGCVKLRGGATQTDMSMIPNTVTNIGAMAFLGCTSLTAFVVPNSVTEMGTSVFEGCTALWNMTLSRNLTKIPDRTFSGCSSLETMVVPEKANYLGEMFFGGTTGENALYYLCANAPTYHADAYKGVSGNMTTYVLQDSRGWDGRPGSRVLPQKWNDYPITYWTPNRFDVTFDANGGRFDSSGGSTWSEQQITDTTYALPSTEPVRPGWAFEGWWTEQTGGAEVRYTTLVTATRTHTLYAHWRSLGTSMTVKFNSNGGTVVTPGMQDYVPGQTFGQFPVPTRRGYTFQGWWTESAGGVRMTEATQVPAADMELFAHWEPIKYYVRFHANGGTGWMEDQKFVFDERQALATHKFTRTGFAFTGWATTPSGQVRYAENASVVNLEEVQDRIVDLYAVWSGVGYSIRFDSNGGTGIMDNQTIAVGETQHLWPCAFARGGYTFAGWALSPTEAEAKKVAYVDGAAVRNLSTENGAIVPLYAVWVTGFQTVRITFDANGGSVAPNDYWDCVVGSALEAFPTPTRPGYTFAGWWTARTGGTRMTSIARVTAAQTFYAYWAGSGGEVPGAWACTVTFNPNGGSVSPTTRSVTSGHAVGTLPTPTRTGYAFVGWFTAPEGGVQVYSTTIVNSGVTYYAHWSANGGGTDGGGSDGGGSDGGGSDGGGTDGGGTDGGGSDGGGTDGGGSSGGGSDGGGTDTSSSRVYTEFANGYKWTFKIQGNTAVITNYGEDEWYDVISPKPVGAVTIPSTLGGKPVTGIESFSSGISGSGFGGLTSLTIPASVTSIASCAFLDCTALTSLTVPAWCKKSMYNSRYGNVVKSGGDSGGYLDEEEFLSFVLGCLCQGGSDECSARVASRVKVTYKDVGGGSGGGSDGGGSGGGGSGGGSDGGGSDGGGDVVGNWIAGRFNTGFAKAQTVLGALYGRNGVPVGTMQVKAGKINTKKGTVKISAYATLLVSGKAKKVSAKAVKVELDATGRVLPVTLAFKAPVGEMSFEMAADGTFTLKNGNYSMAERNVGGNWTKAGAKVYVAAGGGRGATALPAGTIEELLPDGEPVIPKGGKWSFAKAAGVKYAKDKKTKVSSLVIDTKKGTNRSAMKLTYAPKTSIFKGSFKVYAIQGGKLKKFTVKVIGVVVDGKGTGSATGPNGMRFDVRVE